MFRDRLRVPSRAWPVLVVAALGLAACSFGSQPSSSPSASPPASPPAVVVPTVPAPGSVPSFQPAPPRLNVVLIMTDDENVDDMAWMPLTRKALGSRGVTFTNAVAPNPLCCPARASVLTGQLSQNNGVWTNFGPHGGYPHLIDPGKVLPVWMQAAGYRTALFGKFLHQYAPIYAGRAPGWTDFRPTIEHVYDYTRYINYLNGKTVEVDHGYHTTWVTRTTVKRIASWSRQPDKPFFIWTNYVAPHDSNPRTCPNGLASGYCWAPPVPAPRDASLYAHDTPPDWKKPSYNEADVSDKPPFIQRRPLVDAATIRQEFLGRVRSLASVDRGVAAIVDELAARRLLDKTLIMFVSDNGYSLGEHRWVGKQLGYEEPLRVPLIMAGPGVAQGREASQLATSVDLTATILDTAGATATRPLDGLTLWPYLENPDRVDYRPGTLTQTGGDAFLQSPDKWTYRGLRNDRYTLNVYGNGFVELYDRRVDPFELDNVATDPGHAMILAQLRERLDALESCAGQSCLMVDPGPAPTTPVSPAVQPSGLLTSGPAAAPAQ